MTFHFKNRIRELRIEAGLSQRQLAEKVGICRQSIVEFEANRMQPRLMTAYLLAWALGVSLLELSDVEIIE